MTTYYFVRINKEDFESNICIKQISFIRINDTKFNSSNTDESIWFIRFWENNYKYAASNDNYKNLKIWQTSRNEKKKNELAILIYDFQTPNLNHQMISRLEIEKGPTLVR